MKLAERVLGISPSATLGIVAQAKAMQAAGIDVIDLAAGEPDFDSPEGAKQEAIRAIESGFTKYTATSGIDPLKHAVIEKLLRDQGVEYSKDEILISCGAKHSLFNLLQAVLSPGDEVLIPSPYWVSYPDQVKLCQGIPVIVPTEQHHGFKTNGDHLKRYVTSRTRALILNSPSNPTGAVYDRQALETIADFAVTNDVLVISDEIYEKYVYDGRQHISIVSLHPDMRARTVVVNGVSKSYAMTGWRIGYAAGPKALISAMAIIQSQSTSNPTSIAQKAALGALREGDDFSKIMVTEFNKRRVWMLDRLNTIPGIRCSKPEGAFYVFADVSDFFGTRSPETTIDSPSSFATYLLQEARVAVVPGEPFGVSRYIRMSYATGIDRLQAALERIDTAVQKLIRSREHGGGIA